MSKNCPLSFPNRFQRIHTKEEEEEGEKKLQAKKTCMGVRSNRAPDESRHPFV